MSSKQIAANRRNAQNSTGPKTPDGKAVSKLNATKHGILAKQVVVRGYKFKESFREFETLLREYHESLAPVGPLEEMLVDKIVTATWRLRRVRMAETGEIALSVDGGCWSREKHDTLSEILFRADNYLSDGIVLELKRSRRGCSFLIHCLVEVRRRVEKEGELTEATVADCKKWLRKDRNDIVFGLEQFRARLSANPEKLGPEALRAEHKERVLTYLDREIEYFGFLMNKRQKREKAEERAKQSAEMLPSPGALEKILRYETTLERQKYRAMNHLERLQRRRQGEHVPPPAVMEVSAAT